MDASFAELMGRLDRLSSQFQDLREEVRQAIAIADQSPSMSLTQARKALEYIVRRVYERHVGEPAGTRPLEGLLQRIAQDGHMPRRLVAYANSVRELGNVGTHAFGEKVERGDVVLALSQLMPILEWYFEREAPTGADRPSASGPADPPLEAGPPASPPPPGPEIAPACDVATVTPPMAAGGGTRPGGLAAGGPTPGRRGIAPALAASVLGLLALAVVLFLKGDEKSLTSREVPQGVVDPSPAQPREPDRATVTAVPGGTAPTAGGGSFPAPVANKAAEPTPTLESLVAPFLLRGAAHKAKGRYDEAIGAYNAAIRFNPEDARAYAERSDVYLRTNDTDRALFDAEAAVRLDPKLVAAYKARGRAFSSKGDNEKAFADYDAAIRLDPNYAIAYKNRGLLYRKTGEAEKAEADRRKAAELEGKK